VPGDGLARERAEEQHEEDDRQRLLLQEAAHQLCMKPRAAQYAIPPAIRIR
jgi:hypothetical protein